MDVDEIAKLARIKLNSLEKERLQNDLGAILSYVTKLNEVKFNQDNVLLKDNENGNEQTNVTREDVSAHQSALYTDKILDEAPSKENNYISRVKLQINRYCF